MPSSAVFDGAAGSYDRTFTNTFLGRLLRARVWDLLAETAQPGERVLELACGTGEDAVWLAEQGVQVVATDGSAEMVATAAEKVRRNDLSEQIELRQLSLQTLASGKPVVEDEPLFDGVFSNFGGLNTVGTWRPLADALARRVRPGGWTVLVVMGPICPWEIGWHLLHLKPGTALRRWRAAVPVRVGAATIPVWYPPPGRLRRAFAPWFRGRALYSLGFWLPPSYLGHLPERWPRLFRLLDGFERRMARRLAGWGDHYVLVLQREAL
jgi:SAM-dependent methyltransferase